ncbi:hypothetical protein QBC34DRAFT_475882 [Podospora aff. communis PSN243]|uniref:Uncharacterized protein n=1 Tax=Podospora aff. communis PSN243 TaxID=3040156 RepID=A0AAV9G9N1_9PEZI|nr:hypothetical protein QBC34DRAFT_475882 [Podospora aff. communis PSN243]
MQEIIIATEAKSLVYQPTIDMHLTAIFLPLLAGQGALAVPHPSRQNTAESNSLSSLPSGVIGVGTFFQRLARSAPWQRPAAYEVYSPSSTYRRKGNRRLTSPKIKIHLDGAPGNGTGGLNGTGTGLVGTGTIGTIIPSTGAIITTFPTPSSPGGTGIPTPPIANLTTSTANVSSTIPLLTTPFSIPTATPSLNHPQSLNTTSAVESIISVSATVITIFSSPPTLTVTGTFLTPTSTRTVWVTAEPAILTQPTSTLTVFVTAPLTPVAGTFTVTLASVTVTSNMMPTPVPNPPTPGPPTPVWTPPGTGTDVVGHTLTIRETRTVLSGVFTSTSVVVIPNSVTDITGSSAEHATWMPPASGTGAESTSPGIGVTV